MTLVFNFFSNFQPKSANCKLNQGSHSSGCKNYIEEYETPRGNIQGGRHCIIQGSGPDNMQALQVETVYHAFINIATTCCPKYY